MNAASSKPAWTGLLVLLLVSLVAGAQEDDTPDEDEELAPVVAAESETELDVPEDSLSGSLDDSVGSIESARGSATQLLEQGWRISGDLRVGLIREEKDLRDGSSSTETEGRGRFRLGGAYNLNEWLIATARLATSCTTEECDPALSVDNSLDTRSSTSHGSITLDELYLHVFRRERFNVALGRLQTKFVTRSGVFAKSLDRNNSNGFNVNWTDGIHGTLHLKDESILHLVSEYNDPDGPSSVRRDPLDFEDSGARVSHFVAWETQNRLGPFTQRAIDITYMPNALLKDGTQSGPIEDYVAIVTRSVIARPFGTRGMRYNIAAEIGYAPETQTRAAAGLPGEGDADGLAWALYASLMEIWPNHSIGINYARADAGWLISPQYRDNEELVEVRYLWRKTQKLALEFRLRGRQDLEQLASEPGKRDELDFFARFTLGFAR
jgi:hypothetical protein